MLHNHNKVNKLIEPRTSSAVALSEGLLRRFAGYVYLKSFISSSIISVGAAME